MATHESEASRESTSTNARSIGLKSIVRGDFSPTDFAVPPGDSDSKYVVDQPGVVHRLEGGDIQRAPFLDISDRVVELTYGHDERGLLGLAFHPEYEQNGKFYVRYSSPPRGETPEGYDHIEVLSEFEATGGDEQVDPNSEQVVMEIPHPHGHHNGGQLAFGPDGYLYFGIGDGGHTGDQGPGHAEEGNGQDITDNHLGSVLRIDVDASQGSRPPTRNDASGDADDETSDRSYTIPDDNPLVGKEGLDEIYAWGFRNPWRLSFDSEGRLFAGDVGEHLFEWVTLVENGGNYGWNIKEGSHCFDPEHQWEPGDDCPDVNDRGEELLDPIVEYPHIKDAQKVGEAVGSAIIGGHVYEGDAIPALQGQYVFGDMSKRYDAPRGRLFAASPGTGSTHEWEFESLEIEGVESNLLDGYLFSIGQDNDGELYLLSSQLLNTKEKQQGAVYKIVPPEESEVSGPRYGWQDAASDAYWYSLYNMNNTFVMSGNGIVFPFQEEQFDSLAQEVAAVMKGIMQRAKFMMRSRKILSKSRKDDLPVKNPHLNIAPYTTGDPHFLEEPDVPVRDRDARPDADTMRWDREKSSHVVSPASMGWTHLKGITWAKSFEHEFNLAPIASKDRPQMLGTAAQLGLKFALQNGHLRKNPDDDDDMRLVGVYRPATDEVVEETASPDDYAAMLWFLSDMVSYAENGWFGYENPSPLIEVDEIQRFADRMADATFAEYPPDAILDATGTRDLGVMLGATGWYGTHAGDPNMANKARDYANDLADAVESKLSADGRVESGVTHQPATQGVVGQGFAWASQLDGVDRLDVAESTIRYMLDELWDPDAGTFASAVDADTYVIRNRDAGDVTGGLLAADTVLGMEGVKDRFATYFDNTFNRGRLQRATRWQAYRPEGQFPVPLPQNAGGEYGQAAVYNAEVEYDTTADEWRVTDDSFDTAGALYLSNQDLWISVWGGSEYPGRGVPGQTDRLEQWEQERTQ